jgi:uncharacterized protein (DUF362 family)
MTHQSGIVCSKKLVNSNDLSLVLDDLFHKLGGLSAKVSPGDKVLIKPNFVAPFEKATTDLMVIDFFIEKIRQLGATPVIGESSGFEFDTEATFDILEIRKLADDRNVELINFEKGGYSHVDIGNGLGSVEIAHSALESRLIINLPVLKRHNITKVTGAVKNLFGLLSKQSRRDLHCYRLEQGIAALARRFRGAIHFVDARHMLSRAVYGESRPLNLFLAGTDPFVLDHFGSRLLGINPESVVYLKGTGQYSIEGDIHEKLPYATDKDSLKEKFHRLLYSVFYRLDKIKCSLWDGDSIIPWLHWYLGIHPEIGEITTEELRDLASLCKVDAISVEEGRIIRERCIKVRCLKCYNEAEPGKVLLRGLNRSRKKELK